jgi:carbon monoxide dehydrogenase subunit G
MDGSSEFQRSVLIEVADLMPGPREIVWDLITDWEHQDDWMLEASDFLVTSDHREGVGVEALATIRIGGIRTRDRVRVSVWDPPERLVIEHVGWVRGRGDIRLTAADLDTRIVWLEALQAPLGIVGHLGLRLFAPLMRRIFRRDLRVLRGLVRARSRSS